jgi:poly(hydroxyalkanoate) depolymerase family esterase
MELVDWRELYAQNQAAIRRAGIAPSPLPTAPADTSPLRSTAVPISRPLAGRGLRFNVHVPRGLEPGTAVPLVCLLHGCTQDAAGFAAVTRMNEAADRHGFVVVYPEQDRGRNQQGCWNWFLPEHQGRGAGEPAAIAAAVREVAGTTAPWSIDHRRVFVAGLSAGAAMATILAATYPDLFAGVAVHSGLAYRSATSVGAAFAAMARGAEKVDTGGGVVHAAMDHRARAIPSIVIHGTADRTVAPVNARQVLVQSMAANALAAPQACGDLEVTRPAATARGRLAGGHPYTRARWTDARGDLVHELVEVQGLGHAWSGGAPGHPHSDPRGPSAADAIWRFFEEATSSARARPAGASTASAGGRPPAICAGGE